MQFTVYQAEKLCFVKNAEQVLNKLGNFLQNKMRISVRLNDQEDMTRLQNKLSSINSDISWHFMADFKL